MAFVQHKSGTSGNSNAVALSFDSNVTAGSCLVIGVSIEDAGGTVVVSSISGNSNTYDLVVGPRRGGSQNGTQWLYVVKVANSGATTVTVNFDATGYPKLSIYEFSGRDATAPAESSSSAQGTSGIPNAGNVTASAGADLVAFCQTGANTPTEGSGYTLDEASSPYWYGASQHKDNVAGGSSSVAFGGPSGGDWVSVAVSLKVASVAGDDIEASGSLSITGAADLDATGSLAAAGSASITGAAILKGPGSMLAAGSASITGSADLDAIGSLVAAGSVSISGSAEITGAAIDIVAAGSLSITGVAALTAAGKLIAHGQIFITGAATLTPIPVVASESGGGFWFDFDYHITLRRKREREEAEQEEAEQALQDAVDRNIAILLHEQERKDADRKALERLKGLVRQYADHTVDVERVDRALKLAAQKQTLASYEALEREFKRMQAEDEEFIFILSMISDLEQ